jgi:hypothetical protein
VGGEVVRLKTGIRRRFFVIDRNNIVPHSINKHLQMSPTLRNARSSRNRISTLAQRFHSYGPAVHDEEPQYWTGTMRIRSAMEQLK